MSLFKFSERVPNTAWRFLPTFITPAAPSALSRSGLAVATSMQLDAQPGDAGVEALDVAPAAEGGTSCRARLSPLVITAAAAAASSRSRPGVIRLNRSMKNRKTP